MKKLKYIILIFVVICLSFPLTSCKKKNEVKSAETKLYYKNSGYVEVLLSDDLKLSSDGKDNIVYFDDDSIMVKSGSEYSVRPKDESYKICYNNIFANFSTGKILKVLIDKKETSNNKENTIDLTINGKTSLSTKLIDFEIVGFSAILKTNSSSIPTISFKNNSFTCTGGSLYFAFLKNDVSIEDSNKNDYSANVNFSLNSKTVSDKKSEKFVLEFLFDLPKSNKEKQAYVILKDTNGDLYLSLMNYNSKLDKFTLSGTSSDVFKYSEITLGFDSTISSSDTYSK